MNLGALGFVGTRGGAGGGGLPVNPYEAIAGLSSLFSPDLCPIVYDDIRPACAAVGHRSAIETVPLLVQADPSSAPQLAQFNGLTNTSAFLFDKTSTQRLVCWEPASDITDGVSGFTLFALLKTTSAGSLEAIVAKGLAVGHWRLGTTTGFAQFNLVQDVTSIETAVTSDAPINDGQVHRVICIYDPAQAPDPTMSMWIDNVPGGPAQLFTGPLQPSAGEPFSFGALAASNGTGGFAFSGLVRDVGSYNRPLRGSDVGKLDVIMRKRT